MFTHTRIVLSLLACWTPLQASILIKLREGQAANALPERQLHLQAADREAKDNEQLGKLTSQA